MPLPDHGRLVAGRGGAWGRSAARRRRSSALLSTPLMWLCLPVRIVARLGAQIELAQKQLSKRTPSAAIRSMLGVSLITEPYALMAWIAWSSVKMKRMLGRSSVGGADVLPGEGDERRGEQRQRGGGGHDTAGRVHDGVLRGQGAQGAAPVQPTAPGMRRNARVRILTRSGRMASRDRPQGASGWPAVDRAVCWPVRKAGPCRGSDPPPEE
jgi:hypothetical protein